MTDIQMPFAAFVPRFAVAFVTLLLLVACDAPSPPGSAGEARGVLTFGLLPDEDREQQIARYAPLLEAIRSKTGLVVELATPKTYSELVNLFATGTVDVAYFGGYTFLIANERHGAIPLVMRDIDARFVSHVVVHRDNHIVRELSDLTGARFSFGSLKSTSGHLMPRYYFSKVGISPEDFFSEVIFSGAHDRTIALVADGTVDAGVANGQIVEGLLAQSADRAPPVRIVWQSPPYVDYVWAVQSSMSEKTRNAIAEVFLSLTRDNPHDRQFLDSIGARHFLPTAVSDFEILRVALDSVEQHTDEGRAP